MDEVQQKSRMLDAVENIASELELLRILREYELKARVVHSPDPWVKPDDAPEE
jgi:hypothetical protein